MERGDLAASIRERFSYGGLTLWEADGKPVSVAGLTRRAAGMVRVGPVYTPPELRGHGYASAATAEVSQAALAAGAEEVLLYTDLANPVSNAIYQRLGYQEIEDRIVLSFSQRLPSVGASRLGPSAPEDIVLLTGRFSVLLSKPPKCVGSRET